MSLPYLPIENEIASILGVSASQFRYTVCLYSCIPLSWIQGKIRNPTIYHIYATLIGTLLIYLPFGYGLLYLFFPIIITYVLMLLFPKYAANLAWLINFPFLIYVHTINASGMKWQEGRMDVTGCLMVLFLKLISTSHCRQDAANGKELNEYQKSKAIHRCPSPLEYLSYLFGLGSLLAGPYFEFTDYKNYVEKKDVFAGKEPVAIRHGFFIFFQGLTCMILFVFLDPIFNINLFFKDEFKSQNIIMRYVISWFIGFTYRQKYYFGWSMSESAAVFAGFGFNGYESVDGNGKSIAKWDRCRNVDILNLEFSNNFVKIPVYWNICTGNFLRRYVYERLTPVGKKPTFFTLLITQLVSSVWHGLNPGYALTFVSSALLIYANKVQYRMEKALNFKDNIMTILIKTVFVMATLNYVVVPFMILSTVPSLDIWMSLWFIPHIYTILVTLIGHIVLNSYAKTDSKKDT